MDIYSITNLITLDAKELASRIMYFSFIQEALSLEKSIRAVDPSGRLLVAVLAEIADLIISELYEEHDGKLPRPFLFSLEYHYDELLEVTRRVSCTVYIMKRLDGLEDAVKIKDIPNWVGVGESQVDAARELRSMLLSGELEMDVPTEKDLADWHTLGEEGGA
ncbi:hypothetical protein NpNSSI1_00001997 [Neofusicoccum parvum]|uniref:Uncharacterized protein n=1 Tax=Neofusicoccum parvum TaxID=310453 RepID=A0ACB5S9S3_9PEZI|nr:hypothetical protein NpPPO83_00007667 [Neofusicoccum parvum]GME59567.1 hypothetical protein NpNSSI1_00001997 [Neofusicoccum parvum]